MNHRSNHHLHYSINFRTTVTFFPLSKRCNSHFSENMKYSKRKTSFWHSSSSLRNKNKSKLSCALFIHKHSSCVAPNSSVNYISINVDFKWYMIHLGNDSFYLSANSQHYFYILWAQTTRTIQNFVWESLVRMSQYWN